MRNLFIFLGKYSFFFFFLLLEGFCYYLVVDNNNFQKASYINSSNDFTASIGGASENTRAYFHLKEENRILAQENAILWNHSLVSFSQLDTTNFIINDTLYRQKYNYISAKVVNNSVNRRNNMITLNRGSRDGIMNDMAVISSKGVVGVVKDVSDNYCTVVSLLHSKRIISAKIKKNNYIGPIEWDGKSSKYVTLLDIPVHARLRKGDLIVTGAYSMSFPENAMIGSVENFKTNDGEFSYSVKVKLSTDFERLSHVYIIKNMQREEQEELENKSKDSD